MASAESPILTVSQKFILTVSEASLSGSPVELREPCWNQLPRGLTRDPDRLASLTVRMGTSSPAGTNCRAIPPEILTGSLLLAVRMNFR
jgi:hypothetical protein